MSLSPAISTFYTLMPVSYDANWPIAQIIILFNVEFSFPVALLKAFMSVSIVIVKWASGLLIYPIAPAIVSLTLISYSFNSAWHNALITFSDIICF